LEFEKSTVNFVNDADGFDPFTKGLTQNGLSLDADAVNGIDNDQSTVGDSESSSDFR
jgi:ABC-type thiamine transport system substrate-binding protein